VASTVKDKPTSVNVIHCLKAADAVRRQGETTPPHQRRQRAMDRASAQRWIARQRAFRVTPPPRSVTDETDTSACPAPHWRRRTIHWPIPTIDRPWPSSGSIASHVLQALPPSGSAAALRQFCTFNAYGEKLATRAFTFGKYSVSTNRRL